MLVGPRKAIAIAVRDYLGRGVVTIATYEARALCVRGRTVGIKLRHEDFRIPTRDHTLREPVDAPEALLAAAGSACAGRLWSGHCGCWAYASAPGCRLAKGAEDPGPWSQGEFAFDE